MLLQKNVDAPFNVFAVIGEEIMWRKYNIQIPDLVYDKYFLRISYFYSLLTSTLKGEAKCSFETLVRHGTVMYYKYPKLRINLHSVST